jgi:hypothetical protein
VRHRKIAVDKLAVLVGQELEAGQLAGLGHRLRVFGPVRLRNAADRDAALLAVVGTVEIEVVLDLLEIRQHVVPAPACGAARFPFVVVGRRAAVGHLAVDRGPAAQHARLLVFPERRPALVWIVVADDLGGDLEFGPVEARIEIRRSRIAVADLRRLIARRRILAGFAQQHLVGAFGGETMGHDGARRSAADDNVVVHYDVSLLFLCSCAVKLA